ncbi:MAG: hypothetical protein KDD28_27390, partial [Phaeodactylibacter sp.]|nr:hypothetical protein [Phaeodactylibacter sp.]
LAKPEPSVLKPQNRKTAEPKNRKTEKCKRRLGSGGSYGAACTELLFHLKFCGSTFCGLK